MVNGLGFGVKQSTVKGLEFRARGLRVRVRVQGWAVLKSWVWGL